MQVADLLQQFFSPVGVSHSDTVAAEVFEQGSVVDVASGEDSLLAALEGLVLNELDSMAVVDERVARYARLLLVGFAETAVYHEALSLGSDRGFAFDGAHGDVPVDDTPCLGVEPELAQDMLANVAAVG